MRVFQNYHKHSHYTNVRISDSAVPLEAYAKRASELGHTILSSAEHGWQGNPWETIKIAKKYNLKPLIGAEAYWVKDRAEKDRSNCHIFIGAKTEKGRQALNDVLSEANLTGFYGQPRLDLPLILSLPSEDVIVTTACVGFWRYEDSEEIIKAMNDHFKYFYLEVQYHNVDTQIDLNKKILQLKKKYNIPLIMGCDSHYIYPEQAQQRTDFLLSKGMNYPDEENWFLDYPDGDVAYQRFANQCVLSHQEICEAIDNTNIFQEIEEYVCPVFNDEIKMPTLYPDWTQEQKNEEYKRLVWAGWDDYKKDVPEEKWDKYISEINKEIQTVIDTNMADYFICDYYIMKKGKENGGWLTKSGRGCFEGDAIITTLGGIKKLKDVNTNDFVVDMKGDIMPVINKFSYEIEEPMVEIQHRHSSPASSPLICTLDHKILIYRNGKINWVEAKDVCVGDYVCRPKINFENKAPEIIDLNKYNVYGFEYDDNFIYEKCPHINSRPYLYSPTDVAFHIKCGRSIIEKIANNTYSKSKKSEKIIQALLNYTGFKTVKEYSEYIQSKRTRKIYRFIPNDEVTNIFIGLMYGDGSCCGDRKCIELAINTSSHKNVFNRNIFTKMAKRFGCSVYENVSKYNSVSHLCINSHIISNFIKSELFVSSKNKIKKFNQSLFFQNEDNRRALLSGLIASDGSIKDGRISFDNTSSSLIGAYILLSDSLPENINNSITIRKSRTTNEGYNCKEEYKVRTSKKVKGDDDYIYLPVTKVKLIPKYKTTVYDIEVPFSHSYLLNNMIVHNSGASFFTNTLLGFSDVDRISASVHMYPERFMSTTRILSSKGIPDIDMNEAPTEPFVRAQAEILGQDHSYPMIAYGTMQKSAAWKLYAKSQGISFEIANAVSEQIKKYETAVKHAAEDEKDDINVNDYIGEEFKEIYSKSKDYLGLITSWSIAPCSSLIYMGSIRKEIGLVKIKDNICCLLDGHAAEEGHFLKNDHLKVSVVDLIYRAYKRIGTEPPRVKKLLEMCPPGDKVWKIYENGCTLGINQCEQTGTAARVAAYKPKNISELSAFVAAIRPGFKSMYKTFERKEPFAYNVKAFDNLIQTEEMPNSFLFYQEQIMAALNYAGIDMADCYTAIKNIAKKRAEKVLAYKDTFIDGFSKAIEKDEGKGETEAKQLALNLWQIIEDSASYSFNASHSYCVALDSLYCAWLKAHHPLEFYEVLLTLSEQKGDKDKMNALKDEAEDYFKIKFPPFRFGQDNRAIKANLENNSITNSIAAIKGYSAGVGAKLYECGLQGFTSFVDVLKWLNSNSIKASKVEPLIKIDYFQQFGNINQLLLILKFWDFLKQGDAKIINKEKAQEIEFAPDILAHRCQTTNSAYKVGDVINELLSDYEKTILSKNIPSPTMKQRIEYDMEILGYADVVTGKEEDRRRLLITDVVAMQNTSGTTWGYRIGTKSLGSGKSARLTVKTNVYENNKIKQGDIVYAADLYKNQGGYWYLLEYKIEA